MTLAIQRPPSISGSMVKLLAAAVLAGCAIAAGVFVLSGGENPDMDVSAAERSDLDARAHSSFTYTLSLAKLVEARCGETPTRSLSAASEGEKQTDLAVAARAWTAARVRARTMTSDKSCDYVISEIKDGERRAQKAGYW
jgi:hypothetical protein